ncbi:Piso0_002039 [Millerozyma farinosa CBS 7064]|uniref:Piso0_002039 protein n=1 Tax=Pichia sorbitophila (strain ATCC MYA-4447 / BCRC 22081 / CBS 7064 / NBRC 10061 / NRRL Y-12695) TaxID=559304 RepID=G8YBI8_PICSO|nr:Piso0_002039 [Millerozyma farinosa CBS 7064]
MESARPSCIELLSQLEDLKMSELKIEEFLSSGEADLDYSKCTGMDSSEDSISVRSQSTAQTSVYENTASEQKWRGKESFEQNVNIGISNVRNLENVLECVSDMLKQEEQDIELQLRSLVEEIESSVAYNTQTISGPLVRSVRPSRKDPPKKPVPENSRPCRRAPPDI